MVLAKASHNHKNSDEYILMLIPVLESYNVKVILICQTSTYSTHKQKDLRALRSASYPYCAQGEIKCLFRVMPCSKK